MRFLDMTMSNVYHFRPARSLPQPVSSSGMSQKVTEVRQIVAACDENDLDGETKIKVLELLALITETAAEPESQHSSGRMPEP